MAPARTVENTDFYVLLCGCLESCVENVPPLFRHEAHFAFWHFALFKTLNSDERTVDALFFHRFKVIDNSLLADVTRKPIPVARCLDIGRRLECGFKLGCLGIQTKG